MSERKDKRGVCIWLETTHEYFRVQEKCGDAQAGRQLEKVSFQDFDQIQIEIV